MKKKLIAGLVGLLLAAGAGYLGWDRYLNDSWSARQSELKQEILSNLARQGAPADKAEVFAECVSQGFTKAAEDSGCELSKSKPTAQLLDECGAKNQAFGLQAMMSLMECAQQVQ